MGEDVTGPSARDIYAPSYPTRKQQRMSGYLALLILVPIAVLVIVLLVIECRLERKREEEDSDD